MSRAGQRGLDGVNDLFGAAIRLTRMPIVITDPRKADNPIVFANEAFCRLTGYAEDEAIGRNCRFLQGQETDPDAVRRIREALTAGTAIEIDIHNHRKDGTLFWNRLLIAPVRDARGAIIYFFANQFDVTLEREVLAQRTHELAETREALRMEAAERASVEDAFRQARKMEAVGRLTGGIAHDFNNMLQAIGICLDIANSRLEQGQPEDATRLVNVARKTVDKAAALTHRFLAFSRPQALQPQRIVVDTLVRDMSDLVERTVGREIRIELDLQADTWAVFCDPNQLENTLLNLVINARDAMHDGGSLTIGTRRLTLDQADVCTPDQAVTGDYVRLFVQDTGTGMDAVTKNQAFEPFFTTKSPDRGTGLGLSQIQHFVRQAGGLVSIDSAPAEGTTVSVILPRCTLAETTGTRTPGPACDAAILNRPATRH